ncbi:MAG: hypothetical protein AB7U76_24010 [Pirellulales bacterium]
MKCGEIRRPLALTLAVAVGACGWTVTPPRPGGNSVRARLVADAAILQVNGAGLAWGSQGLGETVRDTLIAAGSFREVYYPVEPRNPPALRLMVDARGTVDEEVGLGAVKAAAIGALMFLPVGVIRFNKTYDMDAEVKVLSEGREVKRFRVESETEVSHTMFSTMEDYGPAARKAAFTDLGQRMVAELSTVSLPPS